jgi:hypothetical protein
MLKQALALSLQEAELTEIKKLEEEKGQKKSSLLLEPLPPLKIAHKKVEEKPVVEVPVVKQ